MTCVNALNCERALQSTLGRKKIAVLFFFFFKSRSRSNCDKICVRGVVSAPISPREERGEFAEEAGKGFHMKEGRGMRGGVESSFTSLPSGYILWQQQRRMEKMSQL